MRAFKTRVFMRWAKKSGLKDEVLKEGIKEIKGGNLGSPLGSGLYKKRMAAPGRGKSGGYRVFYSHANGRVTFLLFGLEKNDRENIDVHELEMLRKLSNEYLNLDELWIKKLAKGGELTEVNYE